MYLSKIHHERWPNGSLPEHAERWPLFIRLALILALFAGLTAALATAPTPSDDAMSVVMAD